jgi:hypothetical protein
MPDPSTPGGAPRRGSPRPGSISALALGTKRKSARAAGTRAPPPGRETRVATGRLSDSARAITRSNPHGNSVLVIEEVFPAPREPCFRFMVADVTVAVLYWEDAPSPGDEALNPVGWTWFRASSPEHRKVLSGATPYPRLLRSTALRHKSNVTWSAGLQRSASPTYELRVSLGCFLRRADAPTAVGKTSRRSWQSIAYVTSLRATGRPPTGHIGSDRTPRARKGRRLPPSAVSPGKGAQSPRKRGRDD